MPPAISSAHAYSLSPSTQRGYNKGESVLFSKRVLAPLGIALVSAAGAYALYRWNQAKKDKAEGDDMFSSKAKKTDGASVQATTARAGVLAGTTATEAQRKKALSDLLDIIEGGAQKHKDNGTVIPASSKIVDEAPSEQEEEDEEQYIHRFFEYTPMPEGYADARSYCLAAVEATIAVLEGKKPKKNKNKEADSDFEDEMSNPDPILQVATQIEVDLRHRLAYYAQEFGFDFFKEDEQASDICATYAGTIPRPPHTPKGPLTKKVLLEAVKEYLEVCAEIDRTKPIVVDLAVQDANGGRDKNAWKHAADEGAMVSSKVKKPKKSKYIDEFQSDEDDEDTFEAEEEVGDNHKGGRSKEAALGRMLANREQRFLGAHAASQMDEILQEKQKKMMRTADKARGMMAKYGDDKDDEDDEDEEGEELENDMSFIGEPLHDINRRAFEAALIRAVLAQITNGVEDPLTKPHLAVLDNVAGQFKEPSEQDDDDDDFDGDDPYGMDFEDDDDYYNPLGPMSRYSQMARRREEALMMGDDDDFDEDDGFDDFDDMAADEEYQRNFRRMMLLQAMGAGSAMRRDQTASSRSAAANRANINMMLGEADGEDRKAMFVDDEDEEDHLDEDKHFDFADDPSREAFIKDMLQREAAEYETMKKASSGGAKATKTTNKKAKAKKAKQEDEDDEWVDY